MADAPARTELKVTTGPIRGHVLRMMSFMLVGMFVQTLYSLVDIYWVGRLGKEAVAAVAVAGNLMFVVIAISQMLGVGTVALVASLLELVEGRPSPSVQLPTKLVVRSSSCAV